MPISDADPDIDFLFPQASAVGYFLRSPVTPDYNCVAWSASVATIQWWPTFYPQQGVYWPPESPKEVTLPAFMHAFSTIGYKDCGMDRSHSPRDEKIAIYADPSDKPTHVARQLFSGMWTSKIGGYRDIHHLTPEALVGTDAVPTKYGRVAVIMSRRRKRSHVCLAKPDEHDEIPPSAFGAKGNMLRSIIEAILKRSE